MNTLQDYYTSIGKPLPSVSERAKIAEQMFGMTNYVGSEQQNGLLLQNLIKPNPVKPAQVTTIQPSLYSGVFKLPNPNTPTTRVADFVQPVINKANEIFGRYNATPTANSTLSNLFTPNNNVFNQLQTNQNVSGINPTGAIAQSIQAGQNGNSNPAIRDGKLVTQPAPTPQISTGQVNTNNNANQTQNFNNQYSNVGNTANTSYQNNQAGTNTSNTATSTTNTVQQPISLSQSLSNLTFDNYTHPSAQDSYFREEQFKGLQAYETALNNALIGNDPEKQKDIEDLRLITAQSERMASQINRQREAAINSRLAVTGISSVNPIQASGIIAQERYNYQTEIMKIKIAENELVKKANESSINRLKEKVGIAKELYNLGINKYETSMKMKQSELNYQKDLNSFQKEQVTPYINSISQSLKGKDINSQKTIIEGFAKNLGVSPDFIKAQVVNNEAQRTSAYSGLIQKYLQDYPDANIPAEALYSNDITAVMNAIKNSSQIYKNSIQGDQLKLAAEKEKLAPGSYASSQPLTASNTSLEQFMGGIAQIESGGQKDPYKAQSPVNRNGKRAYGKYQIMEQNIGPWSKEALGRSISLNEYLNSPELQEQIAKFKFGQIYEKHGNWEDVASVWFSGRPLANNNSADVTGTTVPEYIQKLRKYVGGTTTSTASTNGFDYKKLDKTQLSQLNDTINEVNSSIKNDLQVVSQLKNLESTAELAKSGNAASQISLVFSYMKALDPTSTVREGEFATVQNAAGVPDRIRNSFNKLQNGEFLTSGQIDDIVNEAKGRADVSNKNIERTLQDAEYRASQLFGIPKGAITDYYKNRTGGLEQNNQSNTSTTGSSGVTKSGIKFTITKE